jgi:uncharacterized protein YjbI with pentapeptide repeats
VPLIDQNKDWMYYRDQINQVIDLQYMIERPILLEITIRTLPSLLNGNPVTLTRIYEAYLLGEFARQVINKKREFLIESDNARLRLMGVVACHLYSSEYVGISADQLVKLLQSEFSIDQNLEIEALVRDFINCSFMIREEDQFLFSHRSFMEFLVAKTIAQEVENRKPLHLSQMSLNSTILDFIFDIKPLDTPEWHKVLWSWVDQFRFEINTDRKNIIGDLENGEQRSLIILGSNAISIINRISESLSGIDLSNTILLNAFFQHGKLPNLNLKGSIIADCYFNHSELEQAIFSNVQIKDCKFNHVKLNQAVFLDATIKDTHFNHGTLSDADFTGAVIQDCKINHTRLEKANFSNTNINDSKFNHAALQDTNFEGSKVYNCKFSFGDLSRANLQNIEWKNVRLVNVDGTDALFDTNNQKEISGSVVLRKQIDDESDELYTDEE